MATDPAGTRGRGVARRGVARPGGSPPRNGKPGRKPSRWQRYSGVECCSIRSLDRQPLLLGQRHQIGRHRRIVEHRDLHLALRAAVDVGGIAGGLASGGQRRLHRPQRVPPVEHQRVVDHQHRGITGQQIHAAGDGGAAQAVQHVHHLVEAGPGRSPAGSGSAGRCRRPVRCWDGVAGGGHACLRTGRQPAAGEEAAGGVQHLRRPTRPGSARPGAGRLRPRASE